MCFQAELHRFKSADGAEVMSELNFRKCFLVCLFSFDSKGCWFSLVTSASEAMWLFEVVSLLLARLKQRWSLARCEGELTFGVGVFAAVNSGNFERILLPL